MYYTVASKRKSKLGGSPNAVDYKAQMKQVERKKREEERRRKDQEKAKQRLILSNRIKASKLEKEQKPGVILHSLTPT